MARYVGVRFVGNGSRKWDGKETDVPEYTVVKLGKRGEDGLEEAEVHWPGKGKGKGKVWKCVVLEERTEAEEVAAPAEKRLRVGKPDHVVTEQVRRARKKAEEAKGKKGNGKKVKGKPCQGEQQMFTCI